MYYDNALAMEFALETGIRIGDIVAMKKSSLDGQILSFVEQKTGKEVKKKLLRDLQLNSRDWLIHILRVNIYLRGEVEKITGPGRPLTRTSTELWRELL